MPWHDTKDALGIFDYLYSNYLYAGELARWMVYGVYGVDASPYYVTYMSPPSYLLFFIGRIFGVSDTLFLFSATVCVEQLLFLLGLYLVGKRLFRERLTVFCICLTGLGTVMWHSQIFFSFRLYYLLPLEIYFLLQLREEGRGCFGWLAGIAAILGPQGTPPYFCVLWAFIVTALAIPLFWGSFRSLRGMWQLSASNIIAAVLFVVVALSFIGTLWRCLDNMAIFSPGRQGEPGGISLSSFLTYGGRDLSQMLTALLMPSANTDPDAGWLGVSHYLGLVGMGCLPLALRRLSNWPRRAILIAALALFALSQGGILASLAYCFPGMQIYRHIGYVGGALKLFLLLTAGFGLDALIRAVKEGSVAKYANRRVILLALLALILFVDLNLGGEPWAKVMEAFKLGPGHFASALGEVAIYPLLRAGLVMAFVWGIWWSFRAGAAAEPRSTRLLLALLTMCVAGDCVLFKIQMFRSVHLASQAIAFPAVEPRFSVSYMDKIPAASGPKFDAWKNTPGNDNQMSISSLLQWDPPSPRYRVDWFPHNVSLVLDAAGTGGHDTAIALFGPARSRLRVLTKAIGYATDREALQAIKAGGLPDSTVVLSGPGGENLPAASSEAGPFSGSVALRSFSANALSLTVSNAGRGPAWLVYGDSFCPGWHAAINGQSVPVLKADTAFKALRLRPGVNDVELYYYNGLRFFALRLFACAAGAAAALALGCLLWIALKEPLDDGVTFKVLIAALAIALFGACAWRYVIIGALESKAKQGDPRARFQLIQRYLSGEGVSVNPTNVLRWVFQAAEQGLADAQYQLGMLYVEGEGVTKDFAASAAWFRKAAAQGNAEAQYKLGWLYDNGLGVKPDAAEAANWYQRAAEQGYGPAQNGLGVICCNVKKDYAEAAKWFRKAAGQGSAPAENSLGVLYLNGAGVSRDAGQAYQWFRRSAGQSLAEAQNNLGGLYLNGVGVGRDSGEALKWFERAARQGLAEAQNNCGLVCFDQKRFQESAQWFRKAARQGHAGAQYDLAQMYERGVFYPQDLDEASIWYSRAARQGYGPAELALGKLYHEGKDIGVDNIAAYKWLKLAQLQGVAGAEGELARCAAAMSKEQISAAEAEVNQRDKPK